MNQRNQFIMMGIVGIIAFVGFFAFINQYLQGSRAFVSNVDIQISPNTGEIPEEPITFIVKPQSATEKVSGVDLRVEVENGSLLSWGDCDTVGTSNPALFSNLVATTDQTKGRKSCIVLKGDQELPSAVAVTAVVACKNNDPITIKVDQATTQVVGNVQGFAYNVNTGTATLDCAPSTTTPTPSVTRAPITEDLIADLNPVECSAEVGKNCTYEFNLLALDAQKKISGYYAKFTYDKSIVKGKSITAGNVKGSTSSLLAQGTAVTPPTNVGTQVTPPPAGGTAPTSGTTAPNPGGSTPAQGAPNPVGASCTSTADCQNLCKNLGKPSCPLFCDVSGGAGVCAPTTSATTPGAPGTPGTGGKGCTVVSAKNSPEKGEMEILFTCDQSAATLPNRHTANLVLEGVANGTGALTIQSVQAFGPQKPNGYSVHKTGATYKIGDGGTGGGSGNIELDLKLRFQCIQKKPKARDTMSVKIGIDGNGQAKKYATGEFKVDDKGIWSGTVAFNAPAGTGYRIYPKGSMHMQKRICANNPTEDYPGAYRCDAGTIELKDGKNAIDLSKVILLTGDLPVQDGISNSYDQSLIRNLLGKDNEECKKNADINGDGVCNALDHSCMISALQIRWDDE